jgi:hypothetical protein
MRKLAIVAAAAALSLAAVSPVAAGEKRNDAYYTVHCTDPDGNPTVNESVDARAIEQGGKLGAIDNFNANHDGWLCWAEPGG